MKNVFKHKVYLILTFDLRFKVYGLSLNFIL